MLTREENDLLTQVGPRTPMGDMMRRYWLPAILSREIGEPDGRRSGCACLVRTWWRSAILQGAWA